MEYRIVLHPDLEIDAARFAAAWNDDGECRAAAEARVAEGAGLTKVEGPLLEGAMMVLGNVGLNVTANALYDLIKGLLARRGVKKRTRLLQLDRPDGTRLLVVAIDEG